MSKKIKNRYQIYTDGSCPFNPGGTGGYSAIIIPEKGRKFYSGGAEEESTNNRMEIMAVICGIEKVMKRDKSPDITIYSDSQYVVKSINYWVESWIKTGRIETRANKDLWEHYYSMAKNKKIKARWVRGHNGNRYNELADYMARKERMNLEQELIDSAILT